MGCYGQTIILPDGEEWTNQCIKKINGYVYEKSIEVQVYEKQYRSLIKTSILNNDIF